MRIGRQSRQSLVLASMIMMVAAQGSAETDSKDDPGEAGPAQSAATAELDETVAEQARRIEQLESALRAVNERLDQTDANSVRVGSGMKEDDRGGEAVDRQYVDQRIEDFQDANTNRFMVAGYGTTGIVLDHRNAFGVSFNPAFHFRMTEKLHFNAELEIELEVEDRETEFEFGFEFAQFDYLATDWLVVSGGQFLTPFNTFGPRLHPTWINRFSSMPPIYGGHHGGGGFIPILKTVGAMASGGKALWSEDAKINYAFYVGNGATGHELDDPPDADELLDIDFDNMPDLDDGVATGGRLGFLPISNLEFGASYMTSDPDEVRFHLVGADAWYYWEGLELRGEYAYLKRDADDVKANVQGYWLQAAYRFRQLFPERTGVRGFASRLEPVIRWGQVLDFPEKNGDQLAIGLNYWLFESAPVKLSYEINNGAFNDNRVLINFAYGF